MGFRTKLDYSNNRQIKQHIETLTHLSGATTFGVPFNQLPVGPDLNTSGISQTLTFVGSTFSGNSGITIFTWYDEAMQLGYPYLSAITPSNSAITQNVPSIFTAATTTIIDGNPVVLSYTGISYDLTAIAMYDLGGGDYSGTVVSNNLNYLSANTLDFTGRTIWVDVSGTTRTNQLMVTGGAVVGYVLTCLDADGTVGFQSSTGATGSTNYWSAGTGTDAILVINGSNSSSGILSLAEGFGTQAIGDYSHAEGLLTVASGTGAHSEGRSSQALGVTSHSEGRFTIASGDYSHAEGFTTTAIGLQSHAEGNDTIASGTSAHAEGSTTQANGDYSHAEGVTTIATGYASHAEGATTQALGNASHAEGVFSIASGSSSHAEGFSNALGDYSHSEGQQTQATGTWSHTEGIFTSATGLGSHAQGSGSSATGSFSHAEGVNTIASGLSAHAEGRLTRAYGDYSHAGGLSTIASGLTSFVHGSGSTAGGTGTVVLGRGITGNTSDTTYVDKLNVRNIPVGTSITNLGIDANGFVVVGLGSGTTIAGYWTGSTGLNSLIPAYNTTIAAGDYSIATGNLTEATGDTSTAEGYQTKAWGQYSHAEGYGSKATGLWSHAEGSFSEANGGASHAESLAKTYGDYSHGEGAQTIASGYSSHAQGYGTTALTSYAHSEGYLTLAAGSASHSSGQNTEAWGSASYVGGLFSIASGDTSFVHGSGSTAIGAAINILGAGITGTTPHTTYVENLQIKSACSLSIGAVSVDGPTLQLTSASLSTGLYLFSNSGITLTAATATTFNLGAVRGWIVDSGDVLNANPIFVSYSGGSGLTTPYMIPSPASYLLINSASTLTIQNTKPTNTDRRNNIYLGAVGHPNFVIDSFGNEPDIIMNEMSQMRAMFDPINLINDGVIPYPNSTNLALANTTGKLFGLGIGFITNGNYSPTVIDVPAGAPTTFQYRTQNSASTTNTTLIDPTRYDNLGTATTIGGSNNQATNQRVYLLVDGSIRVQFGQTIYSTIALAKEGASNESFIAFPNNTNLGLLIGMISVRKGATNLSITSDAIFLPVSKFGETVGAAGGVSTATLQSAYNNSGAPEIVTNSTLLGVTIRRGSASDTDYLLVGQNGSGTPLFGINGNGGVTATSLSISAVTFNKLLLEKVGAVTSGNFTGTTKTATVTFTTPFPNTSYAITITGEDSRSWSIDSKTASSFIINSNAGTSLTGNTYWIAKQYGEV